MYPTMLVPVLLTNSPENNFVKPSLFSMAESSLNTPYSILKCIPTTAY